MNRGEKQSMAEETAKQNGGDGRDGRPILLDVKNLVKYFPVRAGILQRVKAWVKAVDNVSFFIYEGESLGLVGESELNSGHIG
jgi:ABC-type glutathione transport system ATPase component